MPTIAEKIAQKIASKAAIRQSVIDKGVTVPEVVTLAELPSYISNIPTGGADWTPQADWELMGEVANNEILLLVADINPFVTFSATCAGGYAVDWGDNEVDFYGSGAIASHTYTVGAGKACSLGYSTFKIRIYAQTPTNSITVFALATGKHTQSNNSLLWAKLGTKGLTTLESCFQTTNNYSAILECIELPDSLSVCTNYNALASNCQSLSKIKMPNVYSTNPISFVGTFTNCYKLRKVNYNVEVINASNFNTCHYYNYALEELIFPTTVNGCISWDNFLTAAYSLKSFTIPSINTNCSCGGMLRETKSLQRIDFPASWNGRMTNIYWTIISPAIVVNFPQSVYLAAYMGFSLPNAKTFRFPDSVTGWASANFYYGIVTDSPNLESITNFPILDSATNVRMAFNNCRNLKNIDNLDKFGDTITGMDMTSTYSGCYSLNPVGGLKVRNKVTGRFVMAGISASQMAAITSIIFTNPAAVSTWAGGSPQIDISYSSLNATALNALFASIIATSASFSGKTIRITGCTGAATCDTTIITNAGGTVNKTT